MSSAKRVKLDDEGRAGARHADLAPGGGVGLAAGTCGGAGCGIGGAGGTGAAAGSCAAGDDGAGTLFEGAS